MLQSLRSDGATLKTYPNPTTLLMIQKLDGGSQDQIAPPIPQPQQPQQQEPAPVVAPERLLQASQLSVRWIDDLDAMEADSHRWETLSQNALRPNLSFGPEFLIPAFRHLNDSGARLLVVESESQWLAAVPLMRIQPFGLPISALAIWNQEQIFDCTPLLHRDHASSALTAIFQFLKTEGIWWLSCDPICDEGLFQKTWQAAVSNVCSNEFIQSRFERACLKPMPNYADYEKEFVSKSLRKNALRQQRKLADLGDLSADESNPDSDFTDLAQQFLNIEASGWKKDLGTALDCNADTRDFFYEVVRRMSSKNQIKFAWVSLDDRPIAMLCDFYQDRIGAAYKTAFCDSYAKQSPGLVNEFLNIERMHQYEIDWIDSCTAPDNQTLNRLWGQRMAFRKSIVSLQSGPSRWLLKCLPLAQSFKKRVQAWRSSDEPNKA